MDKKLLIGGIDPGTTVGYAFIDLEGNVVQVGSEKHLDLGALISRAVDAGKIIIVGCDKGKTPEFVEKFSNSLGARLVTPDKDLAVREKKKLAENSTFCDSHQLDALASAFFSLRKTKRVLEKIQTYIRNYHKEKIADRLTELVILKEMSIKEASDLIERPKRQESKIVNKVIKEKKLSEDDFLKLYSKLKKIEKENALLRKRKNKLEKRLDEASRKKEKKKKDPYEKTFNKLLRQREKRFFILDTELKAKKSEIGSLNEEISKLHSFLSRLSSNILLKKLDNLGSSEIEKKKDILNIEESDVLLVDDPNTFSQREAARLKEKVSVIVYKKKPGRKLREMPFVFIDIRKIKVEENQYFALAEKSSFEKELEKKDRLSKVIEDYKKKRQGRSS